MCPLPHYAPPVSYAYRYPSNILILQILLADRTGAFGIQCRLSSDVCDDLYCGETTHPS